MFLFCTGICHINLIHKYSTPHKLIIIVCFFAITHCFHLRLINVKARSICAVIRIIITLLKCISRICCVIYSTLTGNKSKVGCHRYIHLSIIFDCQCCNRMIFKCEIRTAFITNGKRHSTKRNCIITFSGYFVVYFYRFDFTGTKIIT